MDMNDEHMDVQNTHDECTNCQNACDEHTNASNPHMIIQMINLMQHEHAQ